MKKTDFFDEERLFFDLKNLYEGFGYKQFKMSKFEEYGVYLENKKFLRSPYVITFTDLNGKLMALKPDVTLSIVKNTKATNLQSEKLYYKESVYRPQGATKEFKEISQVGLELIGDVDGYGILEVLSLAGKSLGAIDKNFVLDVSHLGVVLGLMEEYGIVNGDEVLAYVSSKNVHDLKTYCQQKGIDPAFADKVSLLLSAKGSFCEVLAIAKQVATNEVSKQAVDELQIVCDSFGTMGYGDKVRLDFSIINDTDYYNGIVFVGYVSKSPSLVLSGGRYDKLAGKFADVKALGFAIYLNELAMYKQTQYGDETDVLVLYSQNSDYAKVLEYAQQQTDLGKKVLVAKTAPADKKFAQVVEL
ncbi:MAG: ATP phosphoribosyltransferase regulatory subunit [Clostridia bacterium]|nr:ATP phosphoribosyltransferase regulatory subunit [Clostridia bacterium]